MTQSIERIFDLENKVMMLLEKQKALETLINELSAPMTELMKVARELINIKEGEG